MVKTQNTQMTVRHNSAISPRLSGTAYTCLPVLLKALMPLPG